MERRTEKISPPPPPKPGRIKRETAPMTRERKHKVVKTLKLQEPQKGKERMKGKETGEEHSNEEKKEMSSTVINVDSVRQRTNRESEELLGLLESEWHEEGELTTAVHIQNKLMRNRAEHTVIESTFNFKFQHSLEDTEPWSL